MLGVVTTNAATYDAVRCASQDLGACAGIEECNLGLRRLRTLQARLKQHTTISLMLAEWLADQPQIARVLHPGLPSCPGHEIWTRDFDGTAGLFPVELASRDPEAKRTLIDALHHFRIGFNWGGYESLVLPMHPESRSLPRWKDLGPVIRFQVGPEDPAELKDDLEHALVRLG